eukprot:TRINITY_DN11925_c0_g1_i1.p1 TRINITY_DN11925_c0_g1~~TRINITY_DN11925_c0_g1_i1.p1  ORF type:complete len:213 (-),score=45.24 TRINITY_DN11925_c0_g1_i1:61-660(-)
MASEGEMQQLSEVVSWGTQEVGEWLETMGLGQYRGAFTENNVTGTELVLLEKDDLKDLGMASVGHRLKLLDSVKRFKVAANIAQRNKVLAEFKNYSLCYQFRPTRFRLTQTCLELNKAIGVCGYRRKNTDLSSFTDISIRIGCCHSYIMIETVDPSDPEILIVAKRGAPAQRLYEIIKGAWEEDQGRMARPGAGMKSKA